ncbi:MAG: transposase [Bacteroidetes bacterium]|nr:MAG: transposase [Bacteroidota bacterium]
MTKSRRKFTAEERLSILQEAERNGGAETCRKYNLSPNLLAKWKQNYLKTGSTDDHRRGRKTVDPELVALREENEKLKRIVAKQALELEVKTELFKKTPLPSQRNFNL